MKALMRGLMVVVMALFFGVVVMGQEATEVPDIAAVVTEAAPDVVDVADEVAAPIVTVAAISDYGLWGLSIVALIALVMVLSLLVAWLAKNNVTMVDLPSFSTFMMGFVAELGKGAYGQARQTDNPIDDKITLALLKQWFDVTEFSDGTISLVRKTTTPFTT
jgi:hypothetical protein